MLIQKNAFLAAFLALICVFWTVPVLAEDAQIMTIDPVIAETDNGSRLYLRITAPVEGTDLGIVVLSHGARLSRTEYDPLVRYLARHGYVVIQPDHPDATKDGLTDQTAMPAGGWRIRAEQLHWLGSNIEVLGKVAPFLSARTNSSKLAVIGHSFGGQSASLVMGAKSGASDLSFDTPAYRAAILLAPPGQFDGLTAQWKTFASYLQMDWTKMRGPMLIINGDSDNSSMTEDGADWHNDVYRSPAVLGVEKCLMTVANAGHYLGGIDSFLRPPTGDATMAQRELVFGTIADFLGKALSEDSVDEITRNRDDISCK